MNAKYADVVSEQDVLAYIAAQSEMSDCRNVTLDTNGRR